MNEKPLKLKIEKIHKKAVMPTRGTEFSAGLDLTAIDYLVKDEGRNGIVLFKTGLKMEIPEGHFGGIYIRSGLASKGDWMLANDVGVVDSDYRGEIMVMLRYVGGNRFFSRQLNYTTYIQELMGTRIAQMIIQPYTDIVIKSGKVKDTSRGEGGMGSTGI